MEYNGMVVVPAPHQGGLTSREDQTGDVLVEEKGRDLEREDPNGADDVKPSGEVDGGDVVPDPSLAPEEPQASDVRRDQADEKEVDGLAHVHPRAPRLNQDGQVPEDDVRGKVAHHDDLLPPDGSPWRGRDDGRATSVTVGERERDVGADRRTDLPLGESVQGEEGNPELVGVGPEDLELHDVEEVEDGVEGAAPRRAHDKVGENPRGAGTGAGGPLLPAPEQAEPLPPPPAAPGATGGGAPPFALAEAFLAEFFSA